MTKIKGDDDFKTKFRENPTGALESVLGIDLPEEQIKAIIEGVKAKLNLEAAGDLMAKVKKLF